MSESERRVPDYLTTGDVARACEIPIATARRRLMDAGILERWGTWWRVGSGRLRERLPEMYHSVFRYFVLDPESDQD